MSIEVVNEQQTEADMGIQAGDAQQMKIALLARAKDPAAVGSSIEFHELALDLIAAFQAIDDAVYSRVQYEALQLKGNGAYLASGQSKSDAGLTTASA